MHFSWNLTLDGILNFFAILIGALVGFRAVLYQIRESARQSREQVERLDSVRRYERNERRQAVASALLVEITDFKRYHIDPVRDHSRGEKPLVKIFDESPFTIYEMNAVTIGEFDMLAVQSIVHFYDLGKEYMAARRRSQQIMEAALLPGASQDDKWEQSIEFYHNNVVMPLEDLAVVAQEAMNALDEVIHASHG